MGTKSIRFAAVAMAAITPASPSRAGPAPEARFRAMVERPLFSPTRRPPPAFALPSPSDAPVLPDLPAPAPDLSLSGVVTGGGGGVALLKRPQDASPVRVGLGGQVDGWTVAEIHPRAIVLRRDARSVTIDMPAPPR